MPRPNKARSALALYCITLRTSRGLTQQQIAEGAHVHVSSVKAAEGDRDLSVKKLGQLYRSLKRKHALTAGEWHLLLAYWLQREFPAGVELEALAAAVQTTEAGKASAHAERTASLAAALEKLEPSDAQCLADLASAAAGKKGAALMGAVRAALAML